MPAAALPPSTTGSNNGKGALLVNILSAHDLPFAEKNNKPMAVSMQVAGVTVRTAPPIAHQENTNSFRFEQTVRVDMPLSTLYKSKALLTIEYPNSSHSLSAVLECKKLCIHDTTSLTLELKQVIPPKVTTSMTSNGSNDENMRVTTPRLRVQVCLQGPLRTEVAALVNLTRAWFKVMDTATDALVPLVENLPSAKYLSLLLLPSVPLLTGFLVVSPILIGFSVLFFPIVLPLFILTSLVVMGWTSVGVFLLACTRTGRNKIGSTALPLFTFLEKQSAAQIMIYDTGTRPTPVTLVQAYLPTDLLGKLLLSLFMDALGSSSYLLPGIGESFDVIWCPCQTLLIKAMYDSISPNLTYVSFAEEFLPFTDVLPSATIGWFTEFGPDLMQLMREHYNVECMTKWTNSTSNGAHKDSLRARMGSVSSMRA